MDKIVTYPVNDIVCFPQIYQDESLKFVTCGSDGFVKMWDGEKRKRIAQYQLTERSMINRMDLNYKGNKLAVGVSYNFDDIYMRE